MKKFLSVIIALMLISITFSNAAEVQAATIAQVTSVGLKDVSTDSVNLSWSKVEGVTGYKIYQSLSKDKDFKIIKTINGTKTTSYKITGLIPGTTYYYKVRAYKGKGFGKYSKVVKVTTKAIETSRFNSTTFQTGVDMVVFSPKEVYYDNGELIATFYIYNGYNTTANNLNDIHISISNANNEVIASGYFEKMEGAVIAPLTYTTWLFIFSEDDTLIDNADLSYINYEFSLKCNN